MSYCKRRPPPVSHTNEFFPKGFLTESLMTTTYMVSYHDADDQEDLTKKEEKVSLEETKVIKEKESEIHASEELVSLCAHYCDKKTFVDEDLLLGSKPHN